MYNKWYLPSIPRYLEPISLSFGDAQSKFYFPVCISRLSKSEFFCAIKMRWLKILRRNMHSKCHKKIWQINEGAIISCFAFTSPKFAQILKYFAQLCDCMIVAFRNYCNFLNAVINVNILLSCRWIGGHYARVKFSQIYMAGIQKFPK